MTRAERRILLLLADGEWHSESELRSSFLFLQRLCLRGAARRGHDDHRGYIRRSDMATSRHRGRSGRAAPLARRDDALVKLG